MSPTTRSTTPSCKSRSFTAWNSTWRYSNGVLPCGSIYKRSVGVWRSRKRKVWRKEKLLDLLSAPQLFIAKQTLWSGFRPCPSNTRVGNWISCWSNRSTTACEPIRQAKWRSVSPCAFRCLLIEFASWVLQRRERRAWVSPNSIVLTTQGVMAPQLRPSSTSKFIKWSKDSGSKRSGMPLLAKERVRTALGVIRMELWL